VKIGQRLRPRVPSIVRGHSRARVNRCQSRVRSRDGFRSGPALGAPSPTTPRACFRAVRSYRALDPRPRPSSYFAVFTRSIDRRFSGSGRRPTTSATTIDARTHSRASDSRAFDVPLLRSPHRIRPRFLPFLFTGTAFFPSRRRTARATSRDSPSEPTQRRCNTPQSTTRKPPTHRDAACGRRLDPPTACGDGRWTMALDCTGRVAPSKGPPLAPPAAAVRCGQGSPPHLSSSSTPSQSCRRLFDRRAGCSHRPHEPTEALVPTPSHEG